MAIMRRASQVWREADHIQKLLERAAREPLRGPSMSAERAEELVAAIRADRADR